MVLPATPAEPSVPAASEPPVVGLVSMKRARETLSVSDTTLRKLMAAGEVPYIKVGRTRRNQWAELVDYIYKNRTAK